MAGNIYLYVHIGKVTWRYPEKKSP